MESEDEQDDIYDAEKIMKKRIKRGSTQYLIKWKGYHKSKNSWEPEENILGHLLLANFERRQLAKGKKKKGRASAKKAKTKAEMSQPSVENTIPPGNDAPMEINEANRPEMNGDLNAIPPSNYAIPLFNDLNAILPAEEHGDWDATPPAFLEDGELISRPPPEVDGEMNAVPLAEDEDLDYDPNDLASYVGWEAEKIIGVNRQNGEVRFLVKRTDSVHADMVQKDIANELWPNVVISYYESIEKWPDRGMQRNTVGKEKRGE